jgi:hypothetical protein
MSVHAAPDPDEQPPARQGIGPVAAVLVAAIVALTAIVITLVVTGHAENATGIATISILSGVGMAIGFRKQWTR